MRVISLVNQKGGVGKTTSAINISAVLSKKNKRTLLIDLDPQANATSGLGLYENNFTHSIYQAMLGNIEVHQAIYTTAVENLSIIPATKDLAGAEIELVSEFNRERFLKNMIEKINDQFDLIIIDCPPSLGLLTINALTASTEVIIPVQCEYFALEGLARLMQTIESVKKVLNPNLKVKGVLMTMYDNRLGLSRQVDEEARQYLGDLVFQTVIPRNVKLSEAPSFGEPIIVYDKKSKGSKAYKNLAKEIING
jgi:chromosome partitioning protein